MRRTLRQRLPDMAIILLLFALPLLMFWQQTVGGKTLIPAENLYQYQPYYAYRDQVGAPAVPHNALVSDLVLQNFQFKTFIRQSFAQGEIPLWNPYQFSGIPFFAAGQQSTLYPFSLIYYVLPLPNAYGWFMVSQLWLAGSFMFAFMRGLGIRRSGALVAAVTYQLSAFFVISAVFPMIVAAAVWLPLVLLAVERIVAQREPGGRSILPVWIAVGALALGCCVLAGHVEFTYYTLLVAAYYAAARLLYRFWQSRRVSLALSPSPFLAFNFKQLTVSALAVIVMLALGIGIGAVQFIPTYEAAQNNFRVDSASFEQVLGWANPPRNVIQFLLPNFYGSPAHHSYFDLFSGQTVSLMATHDTPILNAEGNPSTTINWGVDRNYVEAALYVGILPLALAAYGLLRRRTVHQVLLALLAVASLTFMFGLPTYALIYILPGIDQLHSPFRWVFPLTFCIAVLAGFGMESLLSAEKSKSTRRFGIALLGVGGLTLLGLLLSRLFYAQIEPLINRIFHALALATQAYSGAAMFYSDQFLNLLIFAVMTLLSGVVFLLPSPRLRGRGLGERSSHGVRGVLAVAFIAADLLVASYSFNPASDPALLDFTPPAIAWLQAQPGEWRYTTYEDPTHTPSQPFNANMTMRYGLRDLRGYESIIPKPYVDLMRSIAPQVQLDFNRVAPIYTSYGDGFDPIIALESPTLDALAVRYVITDTTTSIDADGYTLAYEDEAARIWQNLDAQPLAQVVRTRSPSLPATITSDSGREKFIDLSLPDDDASVLVVSESFDPGWRAFIRPLSGEETDETQVEVVRGEVNNLQYIPLPGAGDWTVRLVYSPASFQIGLFATFISLVLVLLALGIWFWRRFVGAGESASQTMRVARNSLAPILLNLFNRGIDMAFALVMLRILGPTDAGWYFYAGVIFVWFDIFTNFGLNLYLTREVSRDRARAGHIFYNTSAMRIGLAVLGVPLLLGFLGLRQATVTPPIDGTAVIAILILYVGLLPNSLSTGLTSLFYAFERAEIPAAVATAATISKAVFGLLALLGGFGIIGLAAVSIVTNVLTLALLAWNGRDMIRSGRDPAASRLDRPLIRRMIGESWFLMLNHFLATVFFQIDVVILEALRGARVVGQYSVAYKWVSALNIIPAFFTQALLPVMSRQAHEDRAALRRNYILAIKLLVSAALPIAVAFTFMADFLAGLLGGAQYLPDGAIATQLMIWSIPIGWMNSLTQYVLVALDLQRRIMRAFILAVAFNIITNLVFIPQYGYRAAALTTIASEAVLWVPFVRLLSGALGSLPWLSMVWRQGLAAAIMFVALALGWNVQPFLALVVSTAIYVVVLFALRPLDADELNRLRPLLPSRLRRRFA